MTQKERIIRYLKDEGSLTAYEAMKELGIMQLSARLCELVADGYAFEKTDESAIGKYGKVYFKRYRLKEQDDG